MIESDFFRNTKFVVLNIGNFKKVDNPSPMMDTSQYRRDFAAYNGKLEYAHYEYRAGLVEELRVAPIYERYGELFTLEAVESLRDAQADVPEHLETEESGMRALVAAACIGFLDAQAKELTDEIARRESAARVVWEGESLPSFSVPKILANEPSPVLRRDLYARWLDSVSESDNLRVARFESMHQSACALGFDSYRGLYSKIVGTDYDQLARRATTVLNRTETPYRNLLGLIAMRDLPGIDHQELHHSDYFILQRMSCLDRFFPAREVMTTYEMSMKGLGICIGLQKNVQIDDTSRPLKHPRASCQRINPPDDVRLLVSPIGGASDYMTLFHEAGHAQHFGWSSRELVRCHPEFVYSPDNATTESFAFLLNHLFHDSRWLMEHRPGLSEEQSRSIVRDLAFLTTYTIRRFCAKLQYELVLHDPNGIRSERLATTYAKFQAEATGFIRSPAFYLADVDDGFYSGAYIRAWAFEAGLREYLRTKYGYRWWASRKAGDELIDLWSTSSRYSVEELSSLLGMGDLDFDMLAETWIASMSEG